MPDVQFVLLGCLRVRGAIAVRPSSKSYVFMHRMVTFAWLFAIQRKAVNLREPGM